MTTQEIIDVVTQTKATGKQLAGMMHRNPELFLSIQQEKKWSGRQPEEWVPIAEKMAEEHGGTLPGDGWLQKNGYSGLSCCMRKHKELFAHIKKERLKNKKTLSEWVVVAERMAKDNGGLLPVQEEIRRRICYGLVFWIKRNPERFSHIQQQRNGFKSESEWIETAKELASRSGGFLPGMGWLNKNGYSGLGQVIRKRPDLFKSIMAEKLKKQPREWVPTAEKLYNANGFLPNDAWLRENGYKALARCIRVHSELFVRFRQKKLKCNPDRWVKIARGLVSENGGRLPPARIIADRGFTGLLSCIRAHPELFTWMKRSRQPPRPKGIIIKEAEELAGANGGVLPGFSWLKKNGYEALAFYVLHHKDDFKHVMAA
jgi:hypothetical protein